MALEVNSEQRGRARGATRHTLVRRSVETREVAKTTCFVGGSSAAGADRHDGVTEGVTRRMDMNSAVGCVKESMYFPPCTCHV